MNSNNSLGLPARMIPIAISAIVLFLFLLFTAPLSHGEDPFFSIALSKFSNEEAAKKEEAKLKNSGNNAFYKKEKNPENGNIEYQVYIEKYKSMEEAIKEAKVLKDLEIISDYLVKEVIDTPIVEEAPPETPTEGAEAPQPANDSNQVPEVKTGVTENKAPAPDTKIVEGQAPLTAKKEVELKTPEAKPVETVKQESTQKPAEVEGQTKITGQKDAEKKTPVTEVKGAIKTASDTESKKVDTHLPLADKKEVEKTSIPEQGTVSGQIKKEPILLQKEAINQTPGPEKPAEQAPATNEKAANDNILKPRLIEPQKQDQTSGQVRREPIPVQKETLKQIPVSDKPAEQATSTDQKVVIEKVINPANVEPKKQAPEPKPVKDEVQKASTTPVAEAKTETKEAPPEIIRDDTIPEKATPAVANQTTDIKVAETVKVPEKKVPVSVEINDQAKGATLQVGACKEEANAAILKKQLLSLGRTAFYRHESAERMGDIYRIYITGYNTLGDAVKDAKTLVGSGVITGYARAHSKNPAADMPPQKVDAPVNETGNSIYLLHTGSYKEEVNAQRAVALLKESGYKAIFVPEKESTVTWFRVYIGDFRSEAQAREKGLELLDKGVITYFKPVAITPQEKGN